MTSKQTEERPYAKDVEDVLRVRAKGELRKSLLRVRRATPADTLRAGSKLVSERLVAEGVFENARNVALFRTIFSKGEIDTTPIDVALRGRGVRVAYPVLEEEEGGPFFDAEGRPRPPNVEMTFRFVDGELAPAFEDRGRGFPEPAYDLPRADPAELDVVVVPGLGFDPRGFRIGYGAGYYDHFLPTATKARTIGIAFDFQLIVEVPQTEHDVAVSRVVTDKRTLETTAARG